MKKLIVISLVVCSLLGSKPFIYTAYCKTYMPKNYDETDNFYKTCLYKSNIDEASSEFYDLIYNLPIQTHSTMEYLIHHAISREDYSKTNELMIKWGKVDEVDQTFNSFYYIDKAYRTPSEKNHIFQERIKQLLKVDSPDQKQIVDFYKNWLKQYPNEEFYNDGLNFIKLLAIQIK